MDTQAIITLITVLGTIITSAGGALWAVLRWLQPYIEALFEKLGGAIDDHRKLVEKLEKNADDDSRNLKELRDTQQKHGSKLEEIHTDLRRPFHPVTQQS